MSFKTIIKIKDLDFKKLNTFWYNQGFSNELPFDFKNILLKFGCCEVILEETKDSLKYIQIGAPSINSLIEGLNANIKYLDKPAFILGINGMGQSLVYFENNDNKLGIYSIYDSDMESSELKYLAPTLSDLITKKENLQYLE